MDIVETHKGIGHHYMLHTYGAQMSIPGLQLGQNHC